MEIYSKIVEEPVFQGNISKLGIETVTASFHTAKIAKELPHESIAPLR